MTPGTSFLGEAFVAYATASTLVIPLALGAGLDERMASVVSITVGVVAVGLLLTWRTLPSLTRATADRLSPR